MYKRFLSVVLSLMMIVACIPFASASVFAEDAKPTVCVLEDVYGKPGETVDVKIGFRNTAGKNIQQFEVKLSTGEAKLQTSMALEVVPTPSSGGAGVSNENGRVAYGCGVGSMSPETYAVVKVTIPESATDGDIYDLSLSVMPTFTEVLRWEGGESQNGDVEFAGAKLYVSRYEEVSVSVGNTVAEIGQSQIRVPVYMTETDGKLASCTGLGFAISGSGAEKVAFNTVASKEYKIAGVNEEYTTLLPEARTFTLGFASGYENAIAPTGEAFKIFELVFDVIEPLAVGDSFTVTATGADCFKAYGDSATETVALLVKEFALGTVTAELPYTWEVLDEENATARLISYTGTATVVTVPSVVIGDGVVGTEGKEYTVTELYGDSELYEGVFYENGEITSITIPESVVVVDEYAISECPALEKLIVKSPNLEIVENDGSTFLYYYGGKKIGYVLPENLVIWSYTSATVFEWAQDNEAAFENLFAFVGQQIGEEGVRFIGAVADLEYRKVDLQIRVTETGKLFTREASRVYKTLNGIVNGARKPVVTTVADVASETDAYYVEAYSYLFGFAIAGIPAEGTYTFEITPTAITAGGVTVTGKVVTVTCTDGVFSYT